MNIFTWDAPLYDPFATWTRMASAAMTMGKTASKASESIVAAQSVIEARTEIASTAMQSPMKGDYAELGRMIPEKVEAMTKAGTAVAEGWWSMQSAFMAQAQQVGAMMLRGRPPTLAELAALGASHNAYMLQTMDRLVALGSGAVAPVHAKVTANARRLGKRKR